MIYPTVRPMAAMAIKTYYKRIYLSNADRLPLNEPVIIAANHPTAFVEPCVLACFLEPPLYFLVRGDFFKIPIFNFLLRATHMIPIFRLKDGGYKKLKSNYSTFAYCQEALRDNKIIMIMVEGSAIHEKRLRPLQKGFARIVAGTLERYPDIDVKVVPIGVNYTYADRFRSDIMIDVGEPLSSRVLMDENPGKVNRVISLLKDKVEERLKKSVVHINNEEDELLVDVLHQINRSVKNRVFASWRVSNDPAPLKEEKAIADFVNDLDQDRKEAMKTIATAYEKELKRSKLPDRLLEMDKPKTSSRLKLFLVIGFLPFLIGLLWSYIPLRIGKYITENYIFFIEFYAPVMIAACLGFYLVFSLIFLFAILASGIYWLLIPLALMPAFSFFALRYWESYSWWRLVQDYYKEEPELIQRLKADRASLKEMASEVL